MNAAALERAAIHIARPLGLDPTTTPILDARLDDGSRVAICVPPASPSVAITVRRFEKRAFSAAQLVEQGALPEHIREEAERVLHTRRNILVSGGTGGGKTTLLNALIDLLPDDERIVAIEDTLELRIDAPNCVRFEARGLQQGAVTIRDLVRHALRHRPDHRHCQVPHVWRHHDDAAFHSPGESGQVPGAPSRLRFPHQACRLRPENGCGVAHESLAFAAFRFVPTQGSRQNGPLSRRASGTCSCLCRPCPVTGLAALFLPCQGLAVSAIRG